MASTTSLTVPPNALPASLIRAIDQVCAANRRAPPIETFNIVCGAESGLTSWGRKRVTPVLEQTGRNRHDLSHRPGRPLTKSMAEVLVVLTMLLLARLLAGAHTA